MPTITTKFTAVEDLFRKRDLLTRYKTCWERELDQASLTSMQRTDIQNDLELIASIDEDLLRLEQMLQGKIAPQAYNRVENDNLREQITTYLLDAGDIVPASELCTVFDITEVKLRNVMRQLRSAHRVTVTRGGYRGLIVIPVPEDASADGGERRPQ